MVLESSLSETADADDGASPRHPAFDRYLARNRDEQRVLVIRAPGGTGSRWFASSWCSAGSSEPAGRWEDDRRVIRWDPMAEGARGIEARIKRSWPDERVAVLADADAPILELIATLGAVSAGPQDLLLTEAEIARYAEGRRRTDGEHELSAEELFRLTGGWLVAVDALIAAPADRENAGHTLLAPLLRWLTARDPARRLAETGFLPMIDEEILLSFEPSGGQASPTVQELANAGLLFRDAGGGWFMPELIRECLRAVVREQSPELVEYLVQSTMHAVASTGDFDAAVESAVSARSWTSLFSLVLDKGADMFMSDARVLHRLVQRFPRFFRDRMEMLNIFIRILSLAGPDRMVQVLPANKPDLKHDRAARMLREKTESKYRNPDSLAVIYGVLETCYLRGTGSYAESGDTAMRLRKAIEQAMMNRPVSPTLGSLAEVQAGISLHLADRLSEAQLAYERAWAIASGRDHDFLMADTAGKLALVTAQRGFTSEARAWLAKQERPLANLGPTKWGAAMVARAGELARALVALHEMDLGKMESTLAGLPPEPDTDEFWGVHAQLLVLYQALSGNGPVALRRISEWFEDRPYAASAPLVTRLLTEAMHHIRILMGQLEAIPSWEHNPMLANLQALRSLIMGSSDEALRALQSLPNTSHRIQHMAAHMRLIATEFTPGVKPGPAVPARISRIHGDQGELFDLLPYYLLGHVSVLVGDGILTDAELARLRAIPEPEIVSDPRPTLTPRERELLDLLRQGLTRRQMASKTYRSENTIKGQLRTLYAKLGASSSKEALDRARMYGL